MVVGTCGVGRAVVLCVVVVAAIVVDAVSVVVGFIVEAEAVVDCVDVVAAEYCLRSSMVFIDCADYNIDIF